MNYNYEHFPWSKKGWKERSAVHFYCDCCDQSNWRDGSFMEYYSCGYITKVLCFGCYDGRNEHCRNCGYESPRMQSEEESSSKEKIVYRHVRRWSYTVHCMLLELENIRFMKRLKMIRKVKRISKRINRSNTKEKRKLKKIRKRMIAKYMRISK